MAERFRIDLGFPALYASLSLDNSSVTTGVVVYNPTTQQLFYTGSYAEGADGDITNLIATGGLTGGGSSGTVTVTVDYEGTNNIILSAPDYAATSPSTTNDKLLIYNNDALEVQDITVQSFIDNYIPSVVNYWTLIGSNTVNSGSRDVLISSASLTVDQSITKASEDIFLIKRQGVTKVKVNNQGVLTLIPTSSFPTAVTGGIIYKDNDFYFGYL
jgi:hypothetical protein